METAGVRLAGPLRSEPSSSAPLDLDRLLPGGPWEVEIGFGKGRYLLRRAAESPERRFLGVEVASKYFRLAVSRAERRGLDNVLLIHGEALYALAVLLPRGVAAAVHVYFPDPWPKSRHQKRRLFDPETVDLVLGLLKADGRLFFATDFVEYGEQVRELFAGHPALAVTPVEGLWPDGARTNYEAKYVREGRPILRLEVRRAGDELLHPAGRRGLLSALWRAPEEEPPGGDGGETSRPAR